MEILILLALFLLNGVFAMSEMAVVSARRIRLQQLAERGSAGARAALELAENPGPFLSTIQVGITLIGIVSGAFGGAALTERLAPVIAGVPALERYANQIALAIVVVGITFVSLILGELVPKRLALHHPEAIATRIARWMRLLSVVMHPFVVMLTSTSEVLLRMLGVRERVTDTVSEAEIEGLMRAGAKAGVFEHAESQFVSRVLQLDTQRVGAIMTPRVDVVALDLDAPREQWVEAIRTQGFTRYPVVRGDFTEVAGILDTKAIVDDALAGRPIEVVPRMHPPLFVPESIDLIRLLEELKRAKAHLALVVDEYGEVEGIVTMTDVMEAIVGEVPDAGEPADPDVIRRDDGSLLVDGGVSLQRLREAVGRDIGFPEEEAGMYHTLGGFILARLKQVPRAGDHFEFDGLRFEVLDMDRNRIDKVLVAAVVAPDATTGVD